MFQIRTVLSAFLALFFFHSLSAPFANAQFQLYRSPEVRSSTNTLAAAPPSPIDSRQHHEARAVVDVCAFVDAHVLFLDLQICLCLSALPLALEADVKLKALVDILGVNQVTALVTALINEAPSKKQCTCPDNGHLICSAENPCGFTCDPPYVPEGDKCVCKPPYSICNGKCGSYPRGCGSAVPYAGVPRTLRRTRTRSIAGGAQL